MVQRTKKQCSIDGCEKPVHARGWCHKHYKRWQVHGDPNHLKRTYSSPYELLKERVEWQGSCLVWTWGLSDQGYGAFTLNKTSYYAHRVAWEAQKGPIPEGMTVDHMCFNRKCVNIGHLRLLTHRENTQHRLVANYRNTSGYRGVWWNESNKGFCAVVHSMGETYYLGTFKDPREAGIVAAQKRRDLGFPDSPDEIALLGEVDKE